MSRFYDALQKTRESGVPSPAFDIGRGKPTEPGDTAELPGREEARDRESSASSSVRSAPPLGVLPLIRPGSEVHPAYERILQRLLAYRRAKRENVILVVSAVEQEGASTVARKLAIALSQNENERVLLVDANLRAPVQHAAFGTVLADGLTDVLKNSVPLRAAVKSGLGSGPALLASGRPVDNPTHLLSQPAFHGVVSAIRTEFDWVLIDGPPLTVYPDSASLATASGGALLVLRAERTRSQVAEEAARVLEGSGVEILGAILNRRKYHIPSFLYRRL